VTITLTPFQNGEGPRLYAEEMHIPHLCFAAAKEHRSSTRIFFPALVDWDNFPTCYRLTERERAKIYEIMRKTVINTVGAGEAGHWRPTYEAEVARASKGGSTAPEKSGQLIPGGKVAAFGRLLLQRIQKLPWGKGAYFFLEKRGTRGGVQHQQRYHEEKLEEYLSCINQDLINKESFWIDVGHEIQAIDTVLWWRRDAHVKLLAEALGMEEDSPTVKSIIKSTSFYMDEACQLTQAAGFRVKLPRRIYNDLGITYIQAYCTEKAVTYLPGHRTVQLDYKDLLKPGLKEIIRYFEMLENILVPSQDGKVAGNARFEVRVSLSKVRPRLGYIALNNGQMSSTVYQISSDEWW